MSLGMTARAEHSIMTTVRRDDAIFTYDLVVITSEHMVIPDYKCQDDEESRRNKLSQLRRHPYKHI